MKMVVRMMVDICGLWQMYLYPQWSAVVHTFSAHTIVLRPHPSATDPIQSLPAKLLQHCIALSAGQLQWYA